MSRRLTLLFGFTAVCGLCGCPSGAPAPTPSPTATGGAATTTDDRSDQGGEAVASGAPMEAASDATGAGDNAGNTAESGDAANSGGGADASVPAAGFESPEAAFAAMQQGLKDRDWRTAVATLTPQSRDGMTTGMLFAGAMMAAFGGEETAGIAAVFEKHGVEMEEPSVSFSVGPADGEPASEESTEFEPAEIPEIEDQLGFIADMFTALEAMDSPGPDESLAQWTAGELTDLTIDGDTATAMMVSQTADGEQSEEIEFRRGESGWLVHLGDNLLEMGPGEGSPMVGGGPSIGEEGPSEPLAEAVLEEGLKSTIALTFEQPFEQEFFGKDFPDGTLYVTLTLVGDVILDTYEYGEFEVVSAEDGTGATLELASPATNGFNEEFGAEFVELNEFFLDEKNTLPIRFALTSPAEGAAQLSTLELSIRLKTRESIVVEDVLASLGETIEVEDVGEFTIKKQEADNGNPDHGLQIEFKNSGAGVESITLLDGEGQPLDTEGTFSFGFGNSKTFGISTAGKLPDATQMRVTLEGSESIKVVPLKFENLELTR